MLHRSVVAVGIGFTFIGLVVSVGCDQAQVAIAPGGGGPGLSGPGTGTSTATGAGGYGNAGGSILIGGNPNYGGSGGAGEPCDLLNCPADQHCELTDGGAQCVNNSCADLNCGPTEICVTTPGGGAICQDISCDQDVDCPPDQYCNGVICVDDECQPGYRYCTGQDLYECAPNGSDYEFRYTCGSAAYFNSICVDDSQGYAYCSCEDDWDCPEYMFCDVGACEGSGRAPTCFLQPEPMVNVLPTAEIIWGGTAPRLTPSTYAVGSPFEESAQVVLTPVVANLDDDNGDGFINELDFPEIVFMTFCNQEFTTNGVLRAIHGGPAAKKGQDYFATLGSTAWLEGDPLPSGYTCGQADLDSTSGVAIGDLDYDGIPEIVSITEGNHPRIYSNTGVIIATDTLQAVGGNPAPTIANLDGQGFAEILVGKYVFTLDTDTNGDLIFAAKYSTSGQSGANGQGPVSCVANLVGDSTPEIIAGGTVYRFTGTAVEQVWDAGVNGFCAIADVLGVDQTIAPGPTNPLDGLAEVILISDNNVRIFNGQDGTQRRNIAMGTGTRGGPPNVDDFDGDGFPEVGTAASTAYVVIDLQAEGASCPTWTTVTDDNNNKPRTPPSNSCTQDSDCNDLSQFACNEATNSCVCLHNNWRRATEDNSSQVTGSSVFDFNGDGAAEVVYNDECFFFIYDGLTGGVLFNEHSESRTRIEYPIVADVDNDGNAEIVFGTTNESNFCGGDGGDPGIQALYNNGIEVWGDSGDYWVSARRIWNQHAYHVTNVTESGRIPVRAPESWKQYAGRSYNIFRSNPRTQGIAPDLTPTAIQVSSPDATCGQLSSLLDINVQIENLGDLRVGPGVVVGFHGVWLNPPLYEALHDATQTPIQQVIQTSLEPGGAIWLTVSYDAANNAPGVLPDIVKVIVDETGVERECDENNNERTDLVDPGELMADLRVVLGVPTTANCPTVPTTVINDGSLDASDVVVRYYAGDPFQGGTALHDEIVAGPVVAAGGTVSFDVSLPNFPPNTSVLIWGIVDPDNAIEECNDGNNADSADDTILCGTPH